MEWDGEIFEVEWWDRREVSLELVALSYQIQTMPLYNLSALIPPRYRSIRISPKMKGKTAIEHLHKTMALLQQERRDRYIIDEAEKKLKSEGKPPLLRQVAKAVLLSTDGLGHVSFEAMSIASRNMALSSRNSHRFRSDGWSTDYDRYLKTMAHAYSASSSSATGERLAANFPAFPSSETIRIFIKGQHYDPNWTYGLSEKSVMYFLKEASSHYRCVFDAPNPLHAAFSMDATDVEVNQQFNGDEFIGDENYGNITEKVKGASPAALQKEFSSLAAQIRDKTATASDSKITAEALETFAVGVKGELDKALVKANQKLAEKRLKYRSTNEGRGSTSDLFGLQKTCITTYRQNVEQCEGALRHHALIVALAQKRKTDGLFNDAEREEVIDSLKKIFLHTEASSDALLFRGFANSVRSNCRAYHSPRFRPDVANTDRCAA